MLNKWRCQARTDVWNFSTSSPECFKFKEFLRETILLLLVGTTKSKVCSQKVSFQLSFLQRAFVYWFIYCSSLGQNMITSTNTLENLFAVFVSTSGLVLFALLIGNVQVHTKFFFVIDGIFLSFMCCWIKCQLISY